MINLRRLLVAGFAAMILGGGIAAAYALAPDLGFSLWAPLDGGGGFSGREPIVNHPVKLERQRHQNITRTQQINRYE
ncbi:MAG: hypothetical protein J2P49_08405 [Methylocapsa sp.]|nr:hypothetical protein [Methylocapsa sp.]